MAAVAVKEKAASINLDHVCRGCGKVFKKGGKAVSGHLSQNPSCQAAYDNWKDAAVGISSPRWEQQQQQQQQQLGTAEQQLEVPLRSLNVGDGGGEMPPMHQQPAYINPLLVGVASRIGAVEGQLGAMQENVAALNRNFGRYESLPSQIEGLSNRITVLQQDLSAYQRAPLAQQYQPSQGQQQPCTGVVCWFDRQSGMVKFAIVVGIIALAYAALTRGNEVGRKVVGTVATGIATKGVAKMFA